MRATKPTFFFGGEIMSKPEPCRRYDSSDTVAVSSDTGTTSERLALHPYVSKVLGIIEREPSNHHTLDLLAKHVPWSAATLRREFRRSMGVSLRTYLRRQRVSAAAAILRREPFARIDEVAYAVGYDQPSSLSRAFQRELGLRPSEYRARCRMSPALDSADAGSRGPVTTKAAAATRLVCAIVLSIIAGWAANACKETEPEQEDGSTLGDDDVDVLDDSEPLHENWWAEVATGIVLTCARREQGQVTCWGKNGQMVSPVGSFTSVSGGWYHACGLREDGTAACWGDPESGVEDTPDGGFVDVDAGVRHACGVRPDGSIECWGLEDDLQYVDPAPPGTFVDVECGGIHCCALTDEGHIVCWGIDAHGLLEEPMGVFSDLALSNTRFCALRASDGKRECWGTDPLFPLPAVYFSQIDMGINSGCGVDLQGQIDCWGSEDVVHGVPGGTYLQVATDGSHACAIDERHGLSCWGGNGFGECNVPSQY